MDNKKIWNRKWGNYHEFEYLFTGINRMDIVENILKIAEEELKNLIKVSQSPSSMTKILKDYSSIFEEKFVFVQKVYNLKLKSIVNLNIEAIIKRFSKLYVKGFGDQFIVLKDLKTRILESVLSFEHLQVSGNKILHCVKCGKRCSLRGDTTATRLTFICGSHKLKKNGICTSHGTSENGI